MPRPCYFRTSAVLVSLMPIKDDALRACYLYGMMIDLYG